MGFEKSLQLLLSCTVTFYIFLLLNVQEIFDSGEYLPYTAVELFLISRNLGNLI
jgi:hypothetical protein